MALRIARLYEESAEARRLRGLLEVSPPEPWDMAGARVIAHRLGPNAALETVLVDKGSLTGAVLNTPVITPAGVVGRVVRVSAHSANVLLLTDPNSRISVIGRDSRTPGILCGTGAEGVLELLYVPLNAPLKAGEILVTSGLAGIFPKGLPVARVSRIELSDISLFQTVTAEPLAYPRRQEEVLLLQVSAPAEEEGAGGAVPNKAAEAAAAGQGEPPDKKDAGQTPAAR